MSVTTLAAVSLVLLMGLAIQRGSTCVVHAIHELLTERRAGRLTAILEASLWVTGVLSLARLAGLAVGAGSHVGVSAWTVAGGVLLGLGAWVNRACVLGTVAQLGSGNGSYALTPVGYYVGCLVVGGLPLSTRPTAGADLVSLPVAMMLVPLFLCYVLWRVARPVRDALRQADTPLFLMRRLGLAHAATVLVGVSSAILMLLFGRWAYTDVLADLALRTHGMAVPLGPRGWLLGTFLVGALLGGVILGGRRLTGPTWATGGRCFAGGAIMACGALLVPGSNDKLALIGIPLLQPNAWIAFASMVLTVAAVLWVQGAWQRGRRLAS